MHFTLNNKHDGFLHSNLINEYKLVYQYRIEVRYTNYRFWLSFTTLEVVCVENPLPCRRFNRKRIYVLSDFFELSRPLEYFLFLNEISWRQNLT